MHRARLLLPTLLLIAAGHLISAGELQPITISAQHEVEHCTAIVLDNDGHTVFGGNFDHTRTDEGLVFINKRGVVKTSVNTGTTGRRARWTTRYASISFNLVGYLLDTCATVEEVVATDSQVRIFTVDHYLIGDRFGNAVVIEFLNGRMVAHAAPNVPVAALTNNVYEESCDTWERLRRHGNYGGQNSSPHRFCLAADRVDGFRHTSDAKAVAYAFDTLDEVRGQRFSISPTNWSLVFDTKNLRAYYRTNRNYDIRWVDLKDLDLRCGAPVKMIGIHDGGPGDVTEEFFDFDFNVNQYHFERFLDVWGVDLSHQSVMWILNHFDGFSCVQNRRSSPRRVMPVTRRVAPR